MLSIQYYPFGCQNGQQNRQHSSLRIARSAIPMLSVHAVHFALQSSFQAQYSTTHQGRGFVHEPCACLGRSTTRLQSFFRFISTFKVFNNLGNLLFAQRQPKSAQQRRVLSRFCHGPLSGWTGQLAGDSGSQSDELRVKLSAYSTLLIELTTRAALEAFRLTRGR